MAGQGNILIFGATGTIGGALANLAIKNADDAQIFLTGRSRKPDQIAPNVARFQIDLLDENALADLANTIKEAGGINKVIVATGFLHNATIQPEKSVTQIDLSALSAQLSHNLVAPTLVARHFCPLLPRDQRCVFAALSARVGSISDNHLGGWYGYRAAKAGLNMIIRTLAIEMRRRNPQAMVVGLHPGTVQSPLSKPFSKNTKAARLFSPEQSANYLWQVIETLQPSDSGRCMAWDGQPIAP